MENYYNILNINQDSDRQTIKNAYLKLIKSYNNKKELSEYDKTNIKKIKKGYYILKNNELRNMYDNIIRKNKIINNKLSNNNTEFNRKTDKISDRIFDLTQLHQIREVDIDSQNKFINDVRTNYNFNT